VVIVVLAKELKAVQRAQRQNYSKEFDTRIHRAISWLDRSEKESDDDDARFIFLWISFNSAYSLQDELFRNTHPKERAEFGAFIDQLVRLDEARKLYDTVWRNFPGPIRALFDNQYLFAPFWHFQNGYKGFEDWATSFAAAKRKSTRALAKQDTILVLSMIFDRLYVLRNQLLHGAATWNSGVNREQVRDGVAILGRLIPEVLEIMLNNHDADWGQVRYPVIDISLN
jgi:hypothetical protein